MKPKDYHVFTFDEAWNLAMNHLVEGESVPTPYGTKNYPGICAGAYIEEHQDHLVAFHHDSDEDPWTIYFDEPHRRAPKTNSEPSNIIRDRVQELITNIKVCNEALEKLGEAVPELETDVEIHAHIETKRNGYEEEIEKLTGLPIDLLKMD